MLINWKKIEKEKDVGLFFDENVGRILQDRYLHVIICKACNYNLKHFFFTNTTSENSFEILYTALVPCGHEDELNWNKWRGRPAG